MSRIPAVNPAAAEGKAKDLLDTVNKTFGVTPNLFRVAAQSPAALEGLISFQGALGKGKLGPKARGAIALAVAEANACEYCLSAHSALAKGAGLNDGDVALTREGRAAEPKLEALTRFARSLVQSRGRASDADLAQLRKSGVTDGEIIEVVGNVVVNIFTNYLNHVAGTDIDFPVVRALGTAVA